MIALDTNVLVYACDEAEPARQKRAIELIETTTDGVLLWQVACEFIAASRKLSSRGFTPAQAWQRLDEFLDLFPVALPTTDIFGRARELHVGRQLSFWDATIIAACIEQSITRLYSEDIPAQRVPELEIINPFVR
jgi:predicted nucleic acid-binding protein